MFEILASTFVLLQLAMSVTYLIEIAILGRRICGVRLRLLPRLQA